MDPVSLTLGVLPICFSAIQGFVTLKATLKILRGHGREVKRLRKKLCIQTLCFKDELHLILLKVLPPQGTRALLDEKAPSESHTQAIEKLLMEYLGPEKYELFKEIATEADDAITKIEHKLAIYAAPGEKVPWSKATKDAFSVAFKIQGFREEIDTLKDTVWMMRQLRKADDARRKHEAAWHQDREPRASQASSDLVRRFRDVRTAAASFRAALRCAPPCEEDEHSRHSVKLMLHRMLHNPGEASLAFLFEFAGGSNNTVFFSGRLPFQATSQSQPANGVVAAQTPLTNGVYYHAAHRPQQRDPTDPPAAKRPKLAGRPASSSLCRLLTRPSPSAQPPAQMSRFQVELLPPDVPLDGRRVIVADLLSRPVDDIARSVHRIELALALVHATLQHRGTAWWTTGCPLAAVEVLERPEAEEDLGECLKTLHIAEQGVGHEADDDMDMDDDGPDDGGGGGGGGRSSSAVDRQRLRYDKGVRNLDLYCLGVALLQIGLWERVPWNKHELVRRKVERLGFLGERYLKATKRLIYCDFGEGEENLNHEGLQLAICETVIADLESLKRDCQSSRRRKLR